MILSQPRKSYLKKVFSRNVDSSIFAYMGENEFFKVISNNVILLEMLIISCQKSLAVFPQACLCKRVVLVVFVASVHASAFWKALFTR